MNIKEAIELNEKYASGELPIEEAKKFWAEKQEKTLTDKQIQVKTHDLLKLAASLVNKDKARKTIDPEKMGIIFRTVLGDKGEHRTTPYNLWFDILDADGKIVLSATYCDWKTGNSVITDGDGKVLAEDKGWKKVRNILTSAVEKAPKAPKEKKEKTAVPPKAKAGAKAKAKTKAVKKVLPKPEADTAIDDELARAIDATYADTATDPGD